MLIGQTIFVPAAGSPGVFYYGPWMPRQGDALTGVLEVLNASASSGWNLKLEIETKNNEESDASAVSLGGVTVSTAPAVTGSFAAAGCLELVRYRISGTGSGTDRWIHFRANPPIWQPN